MECRFATPLYSMGKTKTNSLRIVAWVLLTATGWAQVTAPPKVEPAASKWKTWVLSSPSQLRPSAPPDAAASAGEMAWLKALRASGDEFSLRQVVYWDQGPPTYHWVQWL